MRRPYATGPPGAAPTPQSRTTTESSAKNRSAAALTTTTPSTEIIMAETTVTPHAGGAMPLSAALRPELPPDFLDTDLSNRRHSW